MAATNTQLPAQKSAGTVVAELQEGPAIQLKGEALPLEEGAPKIVLESAKAVTHATGKKLTNAQIQVERDDKILLFLQAGPARLAQIRDGCFRRQDGTLADETRVIRRMLALKESGYVIATRVKTTRGRGMGGYLVYTIGELGMNDLCVNYALNRDYIRHEVPFADRLTHEMVLSDVIRTVYREAREKKYGLLAIYDDKQMKRNYHKGKVKKGTQIPDLTVTIAPHYGDTVTINIELDTGNKGPKHWRNKVKDWKAPTFILTLNSDRMRSVRGYIAAGSHSCSIGYAVATDFIRNGFAHTKWMWENEEVYRKIKDLY